MPTPSPVQQHHYKRILVIITVLFIIGILAALAYQVFFSPTSRLYYKSQKEQALHAQYETELSQKYADQYKILQESTKAGKSTTPTADQLKALQADFTTSSSKTPTEAQLKAAQDAVQARAEADAEAKQKAYESWKAQQAQ